MKTSLLTFGLAAALVCVGLPVWAAAPQPGGPECAVGDGHVGLFEEAAAGFAESDPPPGCIRVWEGTLDDAKTLRGGGVLSETWTMVSSEKFMACYQKGDYGVDTDRRSIPSGTQHTFVVRCRAHAACVDGIFEPTEEPACELVSRE